MVILNWHNTHTQNPLSLVFLVVLRHCQVSFDILDVCEISAKWDTLTKRFPHGMNTNPIAVGECCCVPLSRALSTEGRPDPSLLPFRGDLFVGFSENFGYTSRHHIMIQVPRQVSLAVTSKNVETSGFPAYFVAKFLLVALPIGSRLSEEVRYLFFTLSGFAPGGVTLAIFQDVRRQGLVPWSTEFFCFKYLKEYVNKMEHLNMGIRNCVEAIPIIVSKIWVWGIFDVQTDDKPRDGMDSTPETILTGWNNSQDHRINSE